MANEPIAFTVAEAASIARTSRTKIYAEDRGKLPIRKIGKRSIILAADLQRWIEQLPTLERRKAA